MYKFNVGKHEYFIVRVQYTTNHAEAKLPTWCEQKFGKEGISNWFRGVVSSRIYQEYWFMEESQALEFYLAWGDST